MEIESYISSGILEGYVLQALSPQEMQEVECMAHIYPEIRKELDRIEDDMAALAMAQQMTPPASVKTSILAQIEQIVPDKLDTDHVDSIDDQATIAPQESAGDKEAKVIAMRTTWMAVAASVLVIIGLSIVLLQVKNDNEQLVESLKVKEQKNEQLLATLEETQSDLASSKSTLDFLALDGTVSVALKGVEGKPENSSVTVLWNQKNEQAFLALGSLPAPPEDKQYQLWALVDGVPVDMGVFDASMNTDLQKMKTVSGAQAFAITLERKGGSPTPTLSEMYVIGNVPS